MSFEHKRLIPIISSSFQLISGVLIKDSVGGRLEFYYGVFMIKTRRKSAFIGPLCKKLLFSAGTVIVYWHYDYLPRLLLSANAVCTFSPSTLFLSTRTFSAANFPNLINQANVILSWYTARIKFLQPCSFIKRTFSWTRESHVPGQCRNSPNSPN